MGDRWVYVRNETGRVGVRNETGRVGSGSIPTHMIQAIALLTSSFGVRPMSRALTEPTDVHEDNAMAHVSMMTVPACGRVSGGHNCSICLELYAKGDEVAVLHCAHAFHWKCAQQWFHRSIACPLCRTNVCASPNNVGA